MLPQSQKIMRRDFFSIENAKAVIKFLYTRAGKRNPWMNYRGLIGGTQEKEFQLMQIIEKHVDEMERVHMEYSSLIRDHFMDGISVEEISKKRGRAPQSIYRDIDGAVQMLCDYMREFEPPFWHCIPPMLDSSPVLASFLSEYVEEVYQFLSAGKSPVGIVGKQGTRRSFIAAEASRLVGDVHLVDACFWVRGAKTTNECRDMVEGLREKLVNDENHLRIRDFLKLKGGNNKIIVVFDDIPDTERQLDNIKEYIRSFPKSWFSLLVGLPYIQVPNKVTIKPLRPEQIESFIHESCKEKGIEEDEIDENIMKELINRSEGWISEVENIMSAAARISGKNRLERALGESWFSLIKRGSSTHDETNPDMVLLQIISLLPGGVREDELQKITGFPSTYIKERLASLLTSTLMFDEEWYSVRPSRRAFLETWHSRMLEQLLNTHNYFSTVKFKAPEGKVLENQSKNLLSLSQNLLAYGKPKEAVQLIVKDGRWFIERIFERDEFEALSFLDIVSSAAEQVGNTEDEMIVKTLRGYFILRHIRVSDEVVEESYKIEKNALDLMENCNDQIAKRKFLRSLLGARCNIADHFRHNKKYEKALEIYSTSIQDVEKLDDEFMKDMWLKHIAFTLMRVNAEEQILEAIDIMNDRILWAQKDQEWRRLAAAYHHLGEAKTILAKRQTSEQRKNTLLEAVNAFENAIQWDTHMLRSRYLGWDYRELSIVYTLLSQNEMINENTYLQLARDNMLEALPRLEKFNDITDNALTLAKELNINFEVADRSS